MMRFGSVYFTILLLTAVLVAACSRGKDKIPVAKVKDRTITLAKFEEAYENVDPAYLPKTTGFEGYREFLDTMIKKEVMAVKADELGYDKDLYVVQGMEAFRTISIQAGYLKLRVADKIKITEKDLRDYYDKYGTILQVKQILVDTKEQADEVYDLLIGGGDFESVCKRYSKAPDAESGGIISNAVFGTFEPQFHEELFTRPVGDVTKPIPSRYGYFIMKIVGKTGRKKESFEELRPQIEDLVRNQKQITLTNELSDKIRAKHGFEWYEDNLVFVFDHLPPDRPLTNPPDRTHEVYPLLKFEPRDLDKPLVKYKNEVLTIKEFSDFYDQASFFRRPRREFRVGDVRKFLLDIVMNELVVDEMKSSRIEEEPEVREMLRHKKEELMINKLYQDQVYNQTIVSPPEIQNYYNDNLERFRSPEERRFSMLVTGDLATAQEAAKKIKSGTDFIRVVTDYSIDEESRRRRGDTDFVKKGEQAEIDDVGFGLKKVGDVSQPFETSRGWMILKLVERRPERILSMDEVVGSIESTLRALKNEERLNSLLSKWKQELSVEVYEDNLKKAEPKRRGKAPPRLG